MQQNTWMKTTMCLVVSLVLVLLIELAVMPTEAQPGEAKVQRVIFASAGFDETNRFWVIGRPNQLQNDPYLETLLDLDPTTGAFIPRLAELLFGSRALVDEGRALKCCRGVVRGNAE